jgi:TRAP-type C4-dicarboxylate transport system substrate-binding protein
VKASNFLPPAGAVALCALLSVTAAAAETLNLYTGNASQNTAVKELQAAGMEIAKRTQGRVSLRIHLAGSLQIQVPDIDQAVSDNILQIGDDQQFASAVPVAGILRLPALLRSRREFETAAHIIEPYVEAQYAKRDLLVLGTYYYPPLVVFSAKRKVDSLADLKGMKIRTLSPESSEWVKRVGGSPVTLSFPELAPALDRTTIDAVLTTASGAGWALRDLVKYNYRLPIAYSQVYEVINRSAHDQLDPADRKVVTDVFGQTLRALTEKIAIDDVTLTQKMQQMGMRITDATAADDAQSQTAMSTFWNGWAKDRGPVVVEALARVRSALGR